MADDKQQRIDKVMALLPTMSVRKACEAVGVAPSTFVGWMRETKDLAEQYAHAKLLYIDKLADEVLSLTDEDIRLDDHGRTDNGLVQQRKLQVDTRKWLLSKLAPKQYGDRLTLAGDSEAPLVTEVKRVIITAKDEEGHG